MEKGTLIKTLKSQRTTSQGEKYDDLLLFYRDENGKKKTIFYDRPTCDFYVIKDKNSDEAKHPPLYIDKDKVEKHTVYSDNLYREIALATGRKDFFNNVRMNGYSQYNFKNLFKSPEIYAADIDLEDQYIAKFYNEHESDVGYSLHKCYFDIENDIMDYSGFANPEDAPCPVCLITLIDEKEMKSHTYILRNKKNKQLTQFEPEVEDFKKYMVDKIKEVDSLDMTFEFYFFDDEIDLIKAFFDKVHEIDPDYCGGWNIMSYDIPTMQNRLKKLHAKAKDHGDDKMDVCDQKYMFQKTYRGEDFFLPPKAYCSIGQGKIGSRVDSFNVIDGINWVDQMLTYAVVHISAGKLDSYKLDNVAYVELGKEKLPFGEGETIRNQLYVNFKRFVEYNIRDVLLCMEIEEKTRDIDMVQRLSDITVTRKEKCFKKSIALTNFVNKFAQEQNLVMSTNKNTSYGELSDAFDAECGRTKPVLESDKKYQSLFEKKDKFGAFVSVPENNDNVGLEVFKNQPSKYLWELVCDFDFSALYPSIIRAFNIDSRNIIGKFYCVDDDIKRKLKEKYKCADMFALSIKDTDREESDDEDEIDKLDDTSTTETDDICSVLTDSIISRDWDMIGNNFFNLPTTEELIKKLERR